MPLYTIRSALLLVALVSALAIAPVAPEAGNILYLAAAGGGIVLLRRIDVAIWRRPVVWMPLAGLILLAVAYGLGSGSVQTMAIGILFFAPFLAIGPLLSLARPPALPDPVLLAVLSLCGVAGAAAVGIGEVATTGAERAGASVANPIHYADVALAAGFLATLGLVYATGPWRYLFLTGPAFALVAVLLSGTRGALLAFLVMAAGAVLLAMLLRQVGWKILVFGAALLAGAIAVALASGIGETAGIQRALADIGSMQQQGLPSDESSSLRLQMYEGGFNAFLASPWLGHGPLAYMEAAGSRASVPFTGVPHLHSDIADFAASGGVLGLLAYLLFLLAPLVEALRAPPSPARAGLVVVVAALTGGYFVMGLTNAMFGILTVTVFFSAIGLAVGLLSRPPATPSP